MRAFHTLVLLGVGLLLGFTFYQDVPGKQSGAAYVSAVAPVALSADLAQAAYKSAQRGIEARLGEELSPAFPSRSEQRTQVRRQNDGTFVVSSWVRTKGAYGIGAQNPWTARVRCTRQSCDVLNYDLQR